MFVTNMRFCDVIRKFLTIAQIVILNSKRFLTWNHNEFRFRQNKYQILIVRSIEFTFVLAHLCFKKIFRKFINNRILRKKNWKTKKFFGRFLIKNAFYTGIFCPADSGSNNLSIGMVWRYIDQTVLFTSQGSKDTVDHNGCLNDCAKWGQREQLIDPSLQLKIVQWAGMRPKVIAKLKLEISK